MAKVKFELKGMKKLEKSFKKLGKVPQKHVTPSARKGMNINLKNAKLKAPYLSGDLKKGMKLSGEKSKIKAKKVYRIVFDEKMNDVFQKHVQNPGESGNPGAKNSAYYPFSQEYGFFARNGRYIPGYRFIHGSFNSNAQKMADTILKEMQKQIEKAFAKERLK